MYRDTMLLKQTKNLLPKKQVWRVARKLVSQHQLRRLWHSKKLGISAFKIFPKISLVFLLSLYLAGYQPTLAIPPIKKSQAYAEFSQQQDIQTTVLPEAFQLPHPGYLTTTFSGWHPGIDIATGLGMPVHPIASGKVIETIYGFWGYGHYVLIEHFQGYRSMYAHMGRIFVKVGDMVSVSSNLGEVGMTGRTSGPHTHLEITKDGKYIDPLTILPQLPTYYLASGSSQVALTK